MSSFSDLGARGAFWMDRWIGIWTHREALVLARWHGVRIGSGTTFRGVPFFRRVAGARIELGSDCDVRSHLRFNVSGIKARTSIAALRPGALVRTGRECGLSGTTIVALERVELGDRVMCGANSYIYDSDMHGLRSDRRSEPEVKPVCIGDDVWLGLNVVVLKGVEIGARTVVAAGSVVTRSLPPDHVCGGIPARPLRPIQ